MVKIFNHRRTGLHTLQQPMGIHYNAYSAFLNQSLAGKPLNVTHSTLGLRPWPSLTFPPGCCPLVMKLRL